MPTPGPVSGSQGDQWRILRRHWSISANVGGKQGKSAQRLSTWLHELGHQVHFWAGEPDLTGVGLLTEYAGKTRMEAAAEAFAAWILARDAMVAHFPNWPNGWRPCWPSHDRQPQRREG